ncbi:hypothetical protein NNRS527_01505 [Nitrosospira sp. NRS527]|nr:hypothetical protein NNRS527_01505 [Nitrosospira sp. NRS527]
MFTQAGQFYSGSVGQYYIGANSDRELIHNPLYIGLCLSEKKFAKEMKRMGNFPPGYRSTPFWTSHDP